MIHWKREKESPSHMHFGHCFLFGVPLPCLVPLFRKDEGRVRWCSTRGTHFPTVYVPARMGRANPLLLCTLVLLNLPAQTRACSFIVANWDISSSLVNTSNFYNRYRGPDITNVRHTNGWTFVHNLLSITGPPTTQPFESGQQPSTQTLAVFKCELRARVERSHSK